MDLHPGLALKLLLQNPPIPLKTSSGRRTTWPFLSLPIQGVALQRLCLLLSTHPESLLILSDTWKRYGWILSGQRLVLSQ